MKKTRPYSLPQPRVIMPSKGLVVRSCSDWCPEPATKLDLDTCRHHELLPASSGKSSTQGSLACSAIDTIFAHAIQPCRRIDPYSFCQGRKDLHHEGNRRFQLGNGAEVWTHFIKRRVAKASASMRVLRYAISRLCDDSSR